MQGGADRQLLTSNIYAREPAGGHRSIAVIFQIILSKREKLLAGGWM
jgi:hypothetical protein